MSIEIKNISWHRNGVAGEGFYSILFIDREGDSAPRTMIASLFEAPGHCAVYQVDLLAEGVNHFGKNSFRGDWFEGDLRKAVEAWNNSKESNKVGPFSIPDLKLRFVGVDITEGDK